MLGRLNFDSLPLYSGIAFGGALITVFGALAAMALITWFGKWGYLWSNWLTSVDHKKIGIMYIMITLVMLGCGRFVDATLMRSQQAVGLKWQRDLPPGHFEQLFSSHGTIMIFFHGDALFRRRHQLSSYAADRRAGRVVSLPEFGQPMADRGRCRPGDDFSRHRQVFHGGWSAYPPYTETNSAPGVGVDYWIWFVSLGVGSTPTGINFRRDHPPGDAPPA